MSLDVYTHVMPVAEVAERSFAALLTSASVIATTRAMLGATHLVTAFGLIVYPSD
jgi:hypothetical protein